MAFTWTEWLWYLWSLVDWFPFLPTRYSCLEHFLCCTRRELAEPQTLPGPQGLQQLHRWVFLGWPPFNSWARIPWLFSSSSVLEGPPLQAFLHNPTVDPCREKGARVWVGIKGGRAGFPGQQSHRQAVCEGVCRQARRHHAPDSHSIHVGMATCVGLKFFLISHPPSKTYPIVTIFLSLLCLVAFLGEHHFRVKTLNFVVRSNTSTLNLSFLIYTIGNNGTYLIWSLLELKEAKYLG